MCKKTAAWSLFLDRDGVINERIPDAYIKDFEDFKFKKDFLDMFPKIAPWFKYIFIVTNQQGIGKGVMAIRDLEIIHDKMLNKVNRLCADYLAQAIGSHASACGLPGAHQIDKIYFCPHLKDENCQCRKPKSGMAYAAKNDFPDIDFEKSLLIGDSESDIEFGKNVGMKTILINNGANKHTEADYSVNDFYEIENIIGRLLK